MNCNICSNSMEFAFKEKILNQYDVQYFFCKECEFLCSEKPFWLTEAYDKSISLSDTGILERNYYFLQSLVLFLTSFDMNRIAKFLIRKLPLFLSFRLLKGQVRPFEKSVLDLGGGYGILVRMLRDIGIDAYWSDQYTENLLSRGFQSENMEEKPAVICAFEVLEHLENPSQQIQNWLDVYNPNFFIFSTLIKHNPIPDKKWWYYSFESGQHISFFSPKSLEIMANKFGYFLYSDNHSFHIFAKKKLKPNVHINANQNKVFEFFKSFYKSKTISDSENLRKR